LNTLIEGMFTSLLLGGYYGAGRRGGEVQ
jgi:hypothetical protein